MKIKVKEIPREGLEISEQLSADQIGFSIDDLKVVSPFKVHGEIHKNRDLVSADLNVAGQYQSFCSRCLEPVVFARNDKFTIAVEIDPTMDFLDLGEEIRQELLLNISTIVLCKDDCKGLCPSCGMNLNNEKCKCKK